MARDVWIWLGIPGVLASVASRRHLWFGRHDNCERKDKAACSVWSASSSTIAICHISLVHNGNSVPLFFPLVLDSLSDSDLSSNRLTVSRAIAMKFIFALFMFVAYVAAHGFVHQIIIDGKAYLGNAPAVTPSPSVIRQISTIDPVKGASNSNLNCGQNAQPAALVADAMPGSTVAVDWRGNDLIHWFHNTGPIMTYMASCGDATCDKFDAMQAKWFLIDEQGQYPNGTWVQASLNWGAMATVTIPSNLKAGNYMLRQELIALQLAVSVGGAEFYPSCSQLRVGGSQTGQPAQSDLVSLPGAYSDTAPGIYDPNVYDPGSKYTFPGPPVAQFIAGHSTNNNPTPSTAPSTPSSTSGPPASTSSCKLRGGGTNATAYSNNRRALQYHRNLYKPRAVSRIMRNVVLSQ